MSENISQSNSCKPEIKTCQDRLTDIEWEIKLLKQGKADSATLARLQADLANLTKKIDDFTYTRKEDRDAVEKLRAELGQFKSDMDEIKAFYKTFEASQNITQERIADVKEDVKGLNEKQDNLAGAIDNLGDKVDKITTSALFKISGTIQDTFEKRGIKWLSYLFMFIVGCIPIFAFVFLLTGKNILDLLVKIFLSF